MRGVIFHLTLFSYFFNRYITMAIIFEIFVSFSLLRCVTADFSPNKNDYNAYGLKVAANDLMIVQADNDLTEFLVQFSPYTDDVENSTNRRCSIEYDSVSHYIYTVALGKNQSTYSVFFVGEIIDLNEYELEVNRTFVGVLNYTGSLDTIDCSDFTFKIRLVENAFAHQEHLVMATDPLGLVAYGFSNLLTFSYTADTNTLVVHRNNSLSAPSRAFLPFAVDYDGTRGVIAGFLDNGRNKRMLKALIKS